MHKKYILALDQGTTGSRAFIFDNHGEIVASDYKEFKQYFPKPGWVEHDPLEIVSSCIATAEEALQKAGVSPTVVKGLGITNQRETIVVWDRHTGQPVHNAVVWQCRRSAPLCQKLKQKGLEQTIRHKTGLPVDAYFSGTKIRWLLDSNPDWQHRAEQDRS